MWSCWWPGRRRSTARMRGYEGKESKSICSGGRSLNCGIPARNWATEGCRHISPGARFVGWVGQLKRWATVWLVELQSGQGGGGHRPSVRSDSRTGAMSNGWNRTGRWRCGMTVVAVDWLDQLEGTSKPCLAPGTGWSHPSSSHGGGVWPGVRLPLPAWPRRWGWGRWGQSPPTLRPLRVRLYEAWNVALRVRGSGGGGDD